MNLMQIDLFSPTTDEVRTAVAAMQSVHTYDAVTTHVLFAPVMIALVFLLLLFSAPKVREFAYAWLYARMMWVWGIRGRRMLRKERKEQQRGKLMYDITDHIENAVHKHNMTREEADEWYADYMDVHPTFKYAIEGKPKSQVRLKKELLAKHPNWTAKILQFRPKPKKEVLPTQQLMHVHVM